MDRNNLILLRNAIRNTQEGRLLIEYLSDIITSHAINPAKNAEQIKGMAELLHEIKTLPDKADRVIENKRSN